jgi:hypothetical protein
LHRLVLHIPHARRPHALSNISGGARRFRHVDANNPHFVLLPTRSSLVVISFVFRCGARAAVTLICYYIACVVHWHGNNKYVCLNPHSLVHVRVPPSRAPLLLSRSWIPARSSSSLSLRPSARAATASSFPSSLQRSQVQSESCISYHAL